METLPNPKSYVELFHLLFMEQLSLKLDKRLYALKGGCNLRFFFNSIRYSEDIDIDAHTIAPHTLTKTVNKILSSVPFTQILRTRSLSISNISLPKQTQTTQRWKIQLNIPLLPLPINTKIEFSRRESISSISTEAISRELIMTYKLRSILISHYPVTIALQQKIKALILRNETQARDIFDIYHLIQTNEINIEKIFTQNELLTALSNIKIIGFPEFKSQVVSYLEFDYQAQYNNEEAWHAMTEHVSKYIRKYLS